MKLYNDDNPAPNPRKVRIYLAEKGLTVETERVPLMKGAHKAADFLKKNSLGQLPVLETESGAYLAESVAICRYFEALHPSPPMFGTGALDQALVEMWLRRAEFRLWAPMRQVWVNADSRTAGVNPNQFKDYGELNKRIVADAMNWFDRELSDGGEFLAGPNYSMADIVLLCGIDFCAFIHVAMPDEASHLRDWHARISARPSSRA